MSEGLAHAVADAASAWRDPEHPRRAAAVERTLGGDNRFTEQALAFAINQQMHQLSLRRIEQWLRGRSATKARTVGVLSAGNVPLVDLQDFLAVVLTGHRYRGVISSKSPYLLPAFMEEVRAQGGEMDADLINAEKMFVASEAVIATGSDETRAWVHAQCDVHGIAPERRLVRGTRYAVAILDGNESEDELESLAEDALLHEGYGCRNVALIWAPDRVAPDALLQAFAHFRAIFPAHPSTPGSLTMQKAFLEAIERPHAYGEGLEFLLSKGEPEVQPPGHVRWSEYRELSEVAHWIAEHADQLQLVVAPDRVLRKLDLSVSTAPPGNAQRPALDWCADGVDVVDFLAELP